MSQKSIWRFTNEKEELDIYIHDADSALVLGLVLEQSGMTGWKLVHDETAPQAKAPSVQPPPAPVAVQKAQPPKAPKAAAERRKHPRHKVRYRVLISAGSKIFRTHTVDVSEGGIALEKAAPQHFQGGTDCIVIIGHPNRSENLTIRCQLLGEHGSSKRLRFVETDAASAKALAAWLKEQTHQHAQHVAA